MLDRQADEVTIGVQVKTGILVELARFDRWAIGGFDQRRDCVGKVPDTHGPLLEASIEEGVVHGHSVFDLYDAQSSVDPVS